MTLSRSPAPWFLLLVLSGCLFSTTAKLPGEGAEYGTPDSPAGVLANLQLAFARKDLETLESLMAPEYRFTFDGPGPPCGGSWTREEDLTWIGALFGDPRLRRVTLQLDHPGAEPATGLGREGQMRIRPEAPWIEAAFRDNTTLLSAGDVEEFYFRPGDPEQDENPEHWLLVEWVDLAAFETPVAPTGSFTPVAPIRWWALKCEYAAP